MKTILVTGAASGIGAAVTRCLSNRGYNVLATALPEQDCAEIAGLERVTVLRVDFTNPDSIDALIATVRSNGSLDGIINCAGIAVPGPLEVVPPEQLRVQFQVNTLAPFQLVCGLLPELRKNNGRVIIIGAGQARASLPCGGAYGASKAALSALADSLRAEVAAFGIAVSVIEPGAVKTGILQASVAKWDALISKCTLDANVREYYNVAMRKSFKTSEAAFKNAISPDVFAATVVNVLECKTPKPRYLVGKEAKVMALVATLPDTVRAKLMRTMV